VPAWRQRVRSVRDTFRQFGHRAGTVIRDKYGGEDGAAGRYRTYDLSLTKVVLPRARQAENQRVKERVVTNSWRL
jgi:hypothetical protein